MHFNQMINLPCVLSKKSWIYIFVLILMKCLFLIHFSRSKNSSNEFYHHIQTYSQIENCSPIIKNVKQYTVRIGKSIYPKTVPIYSNRSINFACLNSSNEIKKIFIWNSFFKDKTFGYGSLDRIKPFIKNNCPVTKCELLNDRSRLNESDLVLVHMRDDPIDKPPNYRPQHQRWVYVLYESPITIGSFKKWNGFFNMSSSYLRISDFPTFYESTNKLIWARNDSFNNKFNYLKGKKKFAACLISNCQASNRRLDYIKMLKKYIQVDVYGGCGTRCSTAFSNDKNCKESISSIYKFYLAFENTLCDEYITEKFFSILKYPIVPVVLGGGNYDHYIPKSGYINALDYDSPRDLANYLKYLDRNSTAYNSYFKWKKHVQFYPNRIIFSPICEMCIQLHLEKHLGMKKNNVINTMSYTWNKRVNCYYRLFYFFRYVLKLEHFNKIN